MRSAHTCMMHFFVLLFIVTWCSPVYILYSFSRQSKSCYKYCQPAKKNTNTDKKVDNPQITKRPKGHTAHWTAVSKCKLIEEKENKGCTHRHKLSLSLSLSLSLIHTFLCCSFIILKLKELRLFNFLLLKWPYSPCPDTLRCWYSYN